MRRFSSYGPVSKESHYFVPRTELLRTARASLLGDNPAEGGHYITVWASRQSGKSWLLRELAWELASDPDWIVAKIELEILRNGESVMEAARYIISSLNTIAGLDIPLPRTMVEFEACFSSAWLNPFADLTPVIDETRIDTKRLLALYQDYFLANRAYILSCAPRRADNRVYEAAYHFNLYAWLENFLRGFRGSVIPEFPTGNGKIDLLLKYRGGLYDLELKTFASTWSSSWSDEDSDSVESSESGNIMLPKAG